MTSVTRIKLNKATLRALPQADRNLLLRAAYIYNDINFYTRLLQIASQSITMPLDFCDAEGQQALTIVRALIGKVHEGLDFVKTLLKRDRALRTRMLDHFSESGKLALGDLKRKLGKSGIYAYVRNEFVSHYPHEDVLGPLFEDCPEHENWNVLSGITQCNSIFHFAETIVNHAILKKAGCETSPTAFASFLDEVMRTAMQLGELMDELINMLMPEIAPEQVERHEFSALPLLRHVQLPFFVDDAPIVVEDSRALPPDGNVIA